MAIRWPRRSRSSRIGPARCGWARRPASTGARRSQRSSWCDPDKQRAEPGRGLVGRDLGDRFERSDSPALRRSAGAARRRVGAAAGERLAPARRPPRPRVGGGVRRRPDAASPTPADGTPSIERFAYEHRLSGSPRSLYEDRDGNVWVGMRGGLRAAVGGVVRQQHPARGAHARRRAHDRDRRRRQRVGCDRPQPEPVRRTGADGATTCRRRRRCTTTRHGVAVGGDLARRRAGW